MEASIASIASSPVAKEAKVDASVHSVLLWLSECQRAWLLVFDGADVDYDVIENFFPPGVGGNVLISTRIRNMTRLSRPLNAAVEVIEMEEEAAIELLLRSARLQSDIAEESTKEEARKIVDTLCYLPLAIDQAGSFIADGVYSINDYLRLYERQQTRIAMFDSPRFKGSSKYKRAVYSTWDVTFAELECRSKGNTQDALFYRVAIFLLRLFSFFHFDGLDENIFRRAAENGPISAPTEEGLETRIARIIPHRLQQMMRGKRPSLDRRETTPLDILELHDFSLALDTDGAWNPFYFREGIILLLQFSMIKRSANGTAYAIHRLVHRWCRDRTSGDADYSLVWGLAVSILSRSIRHNSGKEEHLYRIAVHTHIMNLIPIPPDNGFLPPEANALFCVFETTQHHWALAETIFSNAIDNYLLNSRYKFTSQYLHYLI
jgi:hypothetical protein